MPVPGAIKSRSICTAEKSVLFQAKSHCPAPQVIRSNRFSLLARSAKPLQLRHYLHANIPLNSKSSKTLESSLALWFTLNHITKNKRNKIDDRSGQWCSVWQNLKFLDFQHTTMLLDVKREGYFSILSVMLNIISAGRSIKRAWYQTLYRQGKCWLKVRWVAQEPVSTFTKAANIAENTN